MNKLPVVDVYLSISLILLKAIKIYYDKIDILLIFYVPLSLPVQFISQTFITFSSPYHSTLLY